MEAPSREDIRATASDTDPSRGRAAFLLIIPGWTAIGLGVGLAARNPAPFLIIGTGLGLVVWGLIVALRRGAR